MERINRTTSGCANCYYFSLGECTYYKKCHRLGLPNLQQIDVGERELEKAKLALAQDYIIKALKLIEGIENEYPKA